MGSVLLEALIVTALGLVVALGANGLRTDGLQLDRDYFPQSVEFQPALIDTPTEQVAVDYDGLDPDVVARLAVQ